MYKARGIWLWIPAASVMFGLASGAFAGPDPGEVTDRTATYTGDQSDGVRIEPDQGVTRLKVHNLIGPISPGSGMPGIVFENTGGDGVAILSGTAQERVVIEMTGSSKPGIEGVGKGVPSSYRSIPVLGLLVPTGPAGPLTVTSYSDITTESDSSSGIFAERHFGRYWADSIASLQNFSPEAVTLSVTSVGGSEANVGTPTAGDEGGLFTLSGDGGWDFDPAGMNEALEAGDSIVTRLAYDVRELTDAGSRVVKGSIAVRVLKRDDGTLRVVPEIYFAEYDTYSDPTSEHALWPNHQAYVDRLLASMGVATGTTAGISVTHHGAITTYGELAHGVETLTLGTTGTTGSSGTIANPATRGGAGTDGGVTRVVNHGSIVTTGESADGVSAESEGGEGGRGGHGAWGRYGARGGTGGTGGLVIIEHAGDVHTEGDRARGIYALSVGGDGGRGGDGTAVTHAAIGGMGGTGGEISVEGSGSITTRGELASGILAISEGGVGGAGGEGAFVNPGREGGEGGLGGRVTVEGGWHIETDGDKAHAIWAKSVGGSAGKGGSGGWASGKPGGGGAASDGGRVVVASDSDATTHGDDSFGLYAQSVGGFGGSGGTSRGPLWSFGGDGGSAGSGGVVSIENLAQASVVTHGLNSHAVFGQSIGGGGGSAGGQFGLIVSLGAEGGAGGHGGTVIIWNEGEAGTFGDFARGVTAQSLGGDGGVAGHGGSVNVTSDGTIGTAGFLSHGVWAQSVGGGGGSGGDSTNISLSYNVDIDHTIAIGGDGGIAGDGGDVTVASNNAIRTEGDHAYGVFAQSVGGGGGIGGESLSLSADLKIMTGADDIAPSTSQNLTLGGDGGAGGQGGAVTVASESRIETSGAFSYGMLAQSVGGGGGVGGRASSYQFELSGHGAEPMQELLDLLSFNSTTIIGGSGGAAGDGGHVKVASAGGNDITTRGDFAVGILAQSVGGGGGAGGNTLSFGFSNDDIPVPSAPILDQLSELTDFSMALGGSAGGGGDGDNIGVVTENNIITEGAFAHGIMAQNVGGGGGFSGISENLGISSLEIAPDAQGIAVHMERVGVSFAGSTGGDGRGGIVNVDHVGDIITTLGGAQGMAIMATGGGNTTVNNRGLVTGSVCLGGAANAFNNTPGATFNPGPTIHLGAGNTLRSAGILSPGGDENIVVTSLTGNIVQEAGGRLLVDIDMADNATDRLDVSGTARLAGETEINTINSHAAVPGVHQATILSGAGGVTDLGLNLVDPSSAVISHRLLFPNETEVQIETSVDFAPRGSVLSTNQRRVAESVSRIQSAGGCDAFAPVTAQLVAMSDAKSLANAYTQMSPNGYDAIASTSVNTVQQYAGTLTKRMHSVRSHLDSSAIAPGFVRADSHAVWAEGFGQNATQDSDDGRVGHTLRIRGVAIGFDYLFTQGILGGVSFAHANTTLSLDDGMGSGDIRSTSGGAVRKLVLRPRVSRWRPFLLKTVLREYQTHKSRRTGSDREQRPRRRSVRRLCRNGNKSERSRLDASALCRPAVLAFARGRIPGDRCRGTEPAHCQTG